MNLPRSLDIAAVGFINNTFGYNPLTQGAILSIDASVDKNIITNAPPAPPNNPYSNTFRPLIEQDSMFYLAAIPGPSFTQGPTGYNTISKTVSSLPTSPCLILQRALLELRTPTLPVIQCSSDSPNIRSLDLRISDLSPITTIWNSRSTGEFPNPAAHFCFCSAQSEHCWFSSGGSRLTRRPSEAARRLNSQPVHAIWRRELGRSQALLKGVSGGARFCHVERSRDISPALPAPFFSSAKIRRPPAVCSALETIIFAVVPIRERA